MILVNDTVPAPILVPLSTLEQGSSFRRVGDGKHYFVGTVGDPQPCFCAEDSLGVYVPSAELVHERSAEVFFGPA